MTTSVQTSTTQNEPRFQQAMVLLLPLSATLQPFGDGLGPLDQLSATQIALLGVLGVVVSVSSLILGIVGLVRLFRGDHYVLGVLALLLPFFALAGWFVSPRPGSSLDRERRAKQAAAGAPNQEQHRVDLERADWERRTRESANRDPRSYVSSSSAPTDERMDPTGAEDLGGESTQEMVLPPPLPPIQPLVSPSSQPTDAGSRRGFRWLPVVIALVLVVIGVWVVLQMRQPTQLDRISAQTDELVARAVSANAAWDAVERELWVASEAGDAASAERRLELFRETDRLLDEILTDTEALLQQSVDLELPTGEAASHALVVEHLREMVASAVDMIDGLHQPPGVKELRLAGLEGLRMAATAIGDEVDTLKR